MEVFRLSKAKYSEDLSGRGAELYGGRWNSKGFPMLYTSANRALCMAEIAVHAPLGLVPVGYMLMTISIPASIKIKRLSKSALGKNWKDFQFTQSTQKIGDDFIKDGKFAILEVPSAVVEGDSNFLINPRHKDARKIKLKEAVPFSFDERLFRVGN